MLPRPPACQKDFFDKLRKWSRMATPFAQFQRIFGFVRHSKTHAGANHSFMRFVIPVHHTQGASRHHGGAATGDMRTIYRLKRRQILSRFPSQNRRDQARQQPSQGSALAQWEQHGKSKNERGGCEKTPQEDKKGFGARKRDKSFFCVV